MEKLTTARSVRFALRDLRSPGKSVGLIVTQGAMHEGHRLILERARAECGVLAVSASLNPLQFTEPARADLYPGVSADDIALCERAGVDLLFTPEPDDSGAPSFSTRVTIDSPLTRLLEGAFRPAYFPGYATALTRNLALFSPDRYYLSDRDWQKSRVASTLIQDMNFPTSVVLCPTARETDGLAVSRQTRLLDAPARQKARVLPYLLATAQDLLDSAMPETQTDKGGVIRHWLETLLQSNQPDVIADYIAVVDPQTLYEIDEIRDRALVMIALRLPGDIRLVDARIIHKR